MIFPPEALRVAIAHCEAAYPNEGCGVFVREASGALRAVPMRNASPAPRTSYQLDPNAQLQVFSGPEPVVCVFHSHVDVDPSFSETDRRLAMADGAPVLPGVSYLVLSVRPTTLDLRLFTWNGADFAASSVPLPASHQPRATSHRG